MLNLSYRKVTSSATYHLEAHAGFFRLLIMEIRVCGVFKRRVQNWKGFCLRVIILKGQYSILRIGPLKKREAFVMKKILLRFLIPKNQNPSSV